MSSALTELRVRDQNKYPSWNEFEDNLSPHRYWRFVQQRYQDVQIASSFGLSVHESAFKKLMDVGAWWDSGTNALEKVIRMQPSNETGDWAIILSSYTLHNMYFSATGSSDGWNFILYHFRKQLSQVYSEWLTAMESVDRGKDNLVIEALIRFLCLSDRKHYGGNDNEVSYVADLYRSLLIYVHLHINRYSRIYTKVYATNPYGIASLAHEKHYSRLYRARMKHFTDFALFVSPEVRK